MENVEEFYEKYRVSLTVLISHTCCVVNAWSRGWLDRVHWKLQPVKGIKLVNTLQPTFDIASWHSDKLPGRKCIASMQISKETAYNLEQKNNKSATRIPVSVSLNQFVKPEEDSCKIRMEHEEDKSRVGFLGLKSKVCSRDNEQSSAFRENGTISRTEHLSSTHSLFPPEQYNQKSSTSPGSKSGDNVEEEELRQSSALSVVDGSRGLGDCHIGLKLGKRIYFEDTNCGGSVKATTTTTTHVSVFPGSSVQSKKPRAMSQGTQPPRCQVEGCKTELTCAKDYHRRHKVCEVHSKSAKVTVAGLEQRFCQQCSRAYSHSLSCGTKFRSEPSASSAAIIQKLCSEDAFEISWGKLKSRHVAIHNRRKLNLATLWNLFKWDGKLVAVVAVYIVDTPLQFSHAFSFCLPGSFSALRTPNSGLQAGYVSSHVTCTHVIGLHVMSSREPMPLSPWRPRAYRRFHVLVEFDEGKRSCRRRLAGHNERRRKPQPDPMAMNTARLASSFHDNRHGNFSMDRSFFMHPRIVSNSMLEDPSDFKLGHGKRTWPRIIKTEDQSTYNAYLQIPAIDPQSYASSLSRNSADGLLLLLQNSKTVPGNVLNQGVPQYMQSSGSPDGQALTLSSSSVTGVMSGLEVRSAVQGLSGVSDSGRALSLLSSHSWSSGASGSASLDMGTRSGVTLEQLIHENQPPIAQPLMQGLQHNFDLVEDKLLTISPQSPTSLVSSGFSASRGNSVDKERHSGSLVSNIGGIGNFEGHMPGLLQGHDIRGSQDASPQDVRCTINLMCRSSTGQTNESQGHAGIAQQGSGQFAEFQSLKSYDSSMFYSQQMM
eukprot:Gb_23724 [translate_table: standard]